MWIAVHAFATLKPHIRGCGPSQRRSLALSSNCSMTSTAQLIVAGQAAHLCHEQCHQVPAGLHKEVQLPGAEHHQGMLDQGCGLTPADITLS